MDTLKENEPLAPRASPGGHCASLVGVLMADHYSSINTADYDLTAKSTKSVAQAQGAREMASLTSNETVELFTLAVDNARQNIQSLAGNTRAAEVAKPKLTLDLKNCGLDKLPPEVVEIIRPDVERYANHLSISLAFAVAKTNPLSKADLCPRLQLAHNRLRDIPLEFTSCSTLKYLNLRDNRFDWIPKAVGSIQFAGSSCRRV